MDNSIHEYYIKRCFELAQRGGKKVGKNPKVGAVIVHQNRIIGEGWHEYEGGPHAEVNAINSVTKQHKEQLVESTIYVSLEPCHHYGKTPPCCDLILKHKIPKVVIACYDPNPKTNGKSVAKLRKNGVEVITSVLENEGVNLIRDFDIINKNKRLYIILKQVQSKDHFIGKKGEQTWLSNQWTSILSHKWRSEIDAIIVGINTVKIDNPNLTNRHYTGTSPVRIVIDPNNQIKENYNLLTDGFQLITFSNHTKTVGKKKWVKINDTQKVLSQIIAYCNEQKLYRILVEGGASTIKFFLEMNLWDEARIIRTPHVLQNGVKANSIRGKKHHSECYESDEVIYIYNDALLKS